MSNNDDFVRSLPIYFGGGSLFAVLVNRAVSGIAPVADASRRVFFLFLMSCLIPFDARIVHLMLLLSTLILKLLAVVKKL